MFIRDGSFTFFRLQLKKTFSEELSLPIHRPPYLYWPFKKKETALVVAGSGKAPSELQGFMEQVVSLPIRLYRGSLSTGKFFVSTFDTYFSYLVDAGSQYINKGIFKTSISFLRNKS